MHYNNPSGLEGEVDPGSGLWLEYTDGPLPLDIGLLALGQFDLDIPPGREAFSAPTAVCPGTCTRKCARPCAPVCVGRALAIASLARAQLKVAFAITSLLRSAASRAPL